MKHKQVLTAVKTWIEKQYPHRLVSTREFVDLIVTTQEHTGEMFMVNTYLQVECKKTDDDMDKAIGQCLRYYTSSQGAPTYLAVPEDYTELKETQRVLEFPNLPIGLLLVHYNSEVMVLREARGKPATISVDLRKAINGTIDLTKA